MCLGFETAHAAFSLFAKGQKKGHTLPSKFACKSLKINKRGTLARAEGSHVRLSPRTGASFDAVRYAVCHAPRAATTMVL
jgi:hypothetical protein